MNFPLARYKRYLKPSELRSTAHRLLDKVTGRKVHDYPLIRAAVEGKRGLEIGGPSGIFRSGQLIPIYEHVGALDNCVFATNTVWHEAGAEFTFDRSKRPGKQIVGEASSTALPDASYDFVLASHALEHVANALKTIFEWRRLLTDGGTLLLIVPHRKETFDWRRPFTTFEHLRRDYDGNVGEDDLTHLDEILELHDLSRDPGAGTMENFRERSARNIENRCLHQHVFSPEVLVEALTFTRMRVQALAVERPYHILALATKTDNADVSRHNAAFLSRTAEWRRRDPFRAA